MKKLFAAAAIASLMLGSVSADAKSFKRGVGENQFYFVGQMEPLEPGVSWYYNWGNQPNEGTNNQIINYTGYEYIPMCWGAYSEDKIRNYCKAHPETKYLLGFNEPNFKAQSNMTPAVAAEKWPAVQALAKELNLKLVSPALNYSPDAPYQDPMKWMEEFVALVGNDAFDYIALHNYGGFGVMQDLCTRFHERFGKDIWVTEWCYWPGGAGSVYVAPSTQIQSMIQSVEWLEKTPWIYRYAWFKAVGAYDGKNQPNYGLEITKNGEGLRELSPQGWVYVYMSDFNPDVWNNVNTTVAASEYIASSGIMLAKGENPDCPRPIEISQINAGAWVQYQFDVPKAGAYKLVLTVSGQGEPTRFDPTFKINLVNTDGTEGAELAKKQFAISGDDTKYTQEYFDLTLPAGRLTLRVSDANPYQPSGIHVSTLRLTEASGIENVTVGHDNGLVDVYTMTGVKVASGVERAKATAGLTPGLYLVGNEKVLVK